jgi:DNA mismatch endonuclease (patch repair protein)
MPRIIATKPLTRSEIMKRVKPKNSGAETSLRSALHKRGLRFRLHHRIEKVSVDIAFISARVAIFVDGCFWHGCPLHATFPKTNKSYWLPKLSENKERDARQSAKLRAAGWSVVRIWEHECRLPSRELIRAIEKEIRLRLRYRQGASCAR